MSARIAIKVCGITEERDAHEAVHLGADALGFDFREGSARAVDPDLVRQIVERLPAFVVTVGVFADLPLIQVLEIARRSGVGLLQFHGDESPSFCAGAAPFRWIKAFRVDATFDPDVLGEFPSTTYLIDARRDGEETLQPFEWRRVRAWSAYGRIVIAGSLPPAHLAMAIEDARPYGIDVLGEVEVAPGKKDLDRLELYIDSVRRAERRIAGEAGERH
jgi:phosphoribosylanthranilate isomerase